MSHHQKPVKPVPPRDKLHLSVLPYENAKLALRSRLLSEFQPFVRQLDITIAGHGATTKIQETWKAQLQADMSGSTFQKVSLNVADLLQPRFMSTYIRTGSLVGLSVDTEDDIIAFDGSGFLILSLCNESYSRLGILGDNSKFGPKKQRHYLEVNLTLSYMRDGKPGYERLKAALRKLGTVTMLFSFCKPSSNHTETKTERIEFPQGCEVENFQVKVEKLPFTTEVVQSHEVAVSPLPPSKTLKRRRDEQDNGLKLQAQEVLDTDDLIRLDIANHQPGRTPNALHVSITGFLHPHLVSETIQQCLPMAAGDTSRSFNLHDFPRSPVSRALRYPHYSYYDYAKNDKPDPFIKSKPSIGTFERDPDSLLMSGTRILVRRSQSDDEQSRNVILVGYNQA